MTGLADNAASSPLATLYVAPHTADPSAGDQTTSECTYTAYARVGVARTSSGWTFAGNSVSPAAQINFPQGTGGSGLATYASVGFNATGSGVGPLLSTSSTVTQS